MSGGCYYQGWMTSRLVAEHVGSGMGERKWLGADGEGQVWWGEESVRQMGRVWLGVVCVWVWAEGSCKAGASLVSRAVRNPPPM